MLIKPMLLLLLPLSAMISIAIRFRAPLELHAISVGQGDSTLVFGRDTPVILIDGGASDIKNTGKYRIIRAYQADRKNKKAETSDQRFADAEWKDIAGTKYEVLCHRMKPSIW